MASVQVIEPIKSEVDDKAYRGIELENGLKVMLVSDPDTDQAAAALDVNVGSGSDPGGWNGLAHFLEHMLFLGTKKFPKAGEYQEFIQSRGGSHNAYTAYDHTNYFFTVSHDSLVAALDRFSRFFIDPTFEEIYVDRERSVVHSEYQARLKDEGRRIWAAQKQILNPGHPASRFSVGSNQTLQDRDGITVRDKLIEFYKRWYSANIMALTVIGREPLDQLETIVRDRFSDIPNFEIEPPLYIQSYLNRELETPFLKVVPNKDINSVSFMFPIPSTFEEYRSKPLNYVANLLGHESKGSLLAALKDRGWADSLSAGSGFLDRQQGTIQISIGLTEPGVDHIEEIGSMLFYNIRQLERAGIQQWRFAEEQQLGEIGFRFAEERNAGSLARSLAARLHDYPMVDVLQGPYIMDSYDPERIEEILTYLIPENVYLQLVTKRNKVRGVSPWYQVKYGIEQIDPGTLEVWRGAGEREFVDLYLPPANPFIPQRLVLQPLEHDSIKPVRLDVNSDVESWHVADQEFQTPRASLYFTIKSSAANSTAQEAVLSEILVRLINDELNTETYAARLAGMRYSLYRHSRGISVRVGGYQDRQTELVRVILGAISDPVIEQDRMELVKAELKRELNNSLKERPSSQTIHEIYRLLVKPYWTEAEQIAEIDSVTVEVLNTHAKNLIAQIEVTLLSHGDVSRPQAQELTDMIRGTFPAAKFVEDVSRSRIRELKRGQTYLRTMDVDHGDTALTYYYQDDEKSVNARAKGALLGQLIESPFYFDLRTTNRVGYLVFASHMDMLEVPGLMLSVQSPTHTAAEVSSLFDAFLEAFPAQIKAMPRQQFEQIKSGLISQILRRDTNLSSRTDRYWEEIDLERFGFNSREQLTDEISGLSQETIIQHMHSLLDSDRRLLVVQSVGSRQGASEKALTSDGRSITGSPEKFRESASVFFPAL
ncbi:MAG: insulinase family protein [bacterium]